jgi:hypothetical protein
MRVGGLATIATVLALHVVVSLAVSVDDDEVPVDSAERESTASLMDVKSMAQRVKEAAQGNGRKARSLFGACRKETQRVCSGRSDVRDCLQQHQRDKAIEDPVCSAWLDARAACKADVAKSDCSSKPFRACLLKLEAGDLSSDCRDSEFYKTLPSKQRRITAQPE